MKRPILEVIRFEEPDIIATSGWRVKLAGFGDGIADNGTFTFFGGTGEPKSVTTGAGLDSIVQAFNNNFGGSWNAEDGQPVIINGEADGGALDGILNLDGSNEETNWNVTYYYTLFEDSDGSSYIFRSN